MDEIKRSEVHKRMEKFFERFTPEQIAEADEQFQNRIMGMFAEFPPQKDIENYEDLTLYLMEYFEYKNGADFTEAKKKLKNNE